MAGLEVVMNTDVNLIGKRKKEGGLAVLLEGDVKEQYLDGDFQKLVDYVFLNAEVTDELQEATRRELKGHLRTNSPSMETLVCFYDENGNQKQYSPEQSKLTSIVRERIPIDIETLYMTLSPDSIVGYR
ncbi:hypothetical protein KY363_01720 [Candidatus Woesearchaeota archaeon]|nr:hypothetical protein [Candidatus Woesearchaeota archaeon]